ncbi:ABC transporter ATP-binding protein [Natranaerobius thermophilus]|uniref:Oligopeptide/dipeptide ABC transporter, ATPase subunit n=1 Tax=Natranaerobius thermophilus (strain ATCC BAA-1301 / DSM 18059 / JW/NM-WN-LF) TaxID=457570 RepID=B2A2T6_NATTJ|nr:ABC transporter ATP-binding protein [Natranaerobius thermophilus]ACB86304.1 oligopeptide/dipeptide ABC transporter, ATPase subunit [Natranaerobius thermophilus JW/NM-WN-LF]
METNSPNNLMTVKNLKKHFPIKGGILSRTIGHVKAVDDISFNIKKGETLGLVGESGCGKSTTGKMLMRLLEPTAGEAYFEDQDVFKFKRKNLKNYRRKVQMIFQDPFSSLQPRATVEDMLGEILKYHGMAKDSTEVRSRVIELMEMVGLSSYHIGRYPHEFSGGQRQRIGIARALSLEPEMIICDEPVSALDVSIQSQIINLLKRLQQELELTYLFIAHDLSVVQHISDRVGVMYLGKIMELTSVDELFDNPLHPYTRSLLEAIPTPDPDATTVRAVVKGDVPSASNPPSGCVFHTRCPESHERCSQQKPSFNKVKADHYVYCHLYE